MTDTNEVIDNIKTLAAEQGLDAVRAYVEGVYSKAEDGPIEVPQEVSDLLISLVPEEIDKREGDSSEKEPA